MKGTVEIRDQKMIIFMGVMIWNFYVLQDMLYIYELATIQMHLSSFLARLP
jgi:hypothetical protein